MADPTASTTNIDTTCIINPIDVSLTTLHVHTTSSQDSSSSTPSPLPSFSRPQPPSGPATAAQALITRHAGGFALVYLPFYIFHLYKLLLHIFGFGDRA
ncbi:hypothetical protein Hypma_008692 [Hypsizygus marmoreus]|uniref:Uncharacterized protein n=1 Tax=Hypsizygus marmoreus TaxID=39966 RepID=A0A369JZS5_HYPMA|nr:hypothetical protein Hypma_008692 [Hypsizygus marmoreus]